MESNDPCLLPIESEKLNTLGTLLPKLTKIFPSVEIWAYFILCAFDLKQVDSDTLIDDMKKMDKDYKANHSDLSIDEYVLFRLNVKQI